MDEKGPGQGPENGREAGTLWRAMKLASRATASGLRVEAKGRERGLALLMAMVVTAILGALSVQFSYNLRANLYMSGNLEAATQAYFNARSATKIALLAVNAKQNFPQFQQFMSMMGQGASTRIELWQRACDFVNIFATGKAEFFGTQLLDFSNEEAVGAKSMREGEAAFKCTVSAEDARVNVNRASTEAVALNPVDPNQPALDPSMAANQQTQQQQRKAAQLYVQLGGLLQPMIAQGLFKTEDEVLELILNVIDWTDADTTKSDIDPQGNFTAAGGAEPDYGQYGYESKNAKMDTTGEVQLVEGMTSDVYCRIRDKLTVFSTDKINVNDADLAVLKGILCQSIQDDLARAQICVMPGLSGLSAMDDALIALEGCRNLKKQVYSTPFTSMSRFTQFFEQFPQAMGTGIPLPITASIVNQQLGVRTKMVRVEAEGVYGNTKRKMVSVVDTSTGALVHFHYE